MDASVPGGSAGFSTNRSLEDLTAFLRKEIEAQR